MVWGALFFLLGIVLGVCIKHHRPQNGWSDDGGELPGLKQNYEQLLLASNQQSLREVTYETLQQEIEELVDTWFAKIDALVFLRLSLESEDGTVYYATDRGTIDNRNAVHDVAERLVVHEERDSALSPRYVSLNARMVASDPAQKELERSFFQLLLVNVRGFILRCLHEHQSMELRLMEAEMELARRVQSILIPKEPLTVNGLRAKAVYSPITYVGGDYLDYIRINERYTCFIVADVSGHGLPASLLATGIRSAVRAVLQKSCYPDEILGRLNQLLYEDLSKTRSFITMLVVVYDSDEHKLLLSRAGHPQPLYLSATQKTVLRCSGGVGLGLLPDSSYKLEDVPLVEEGILLLYTDGLIDTGRKEVVLSGVQDWLDELSLLAGKHRETKEDIIDHMETFIWERTCKGQQTDDISVLILQFPATSDIQLKSLLIEKEHPIS